MIVDKNKPSAQWIKSLSERFPCEQEIDRVLTRKLQNRSGPGYSPISLDTLVAGATALLASTLETEFEISNASWLSGGASKLQMVFTLCWTPPGGKSTTQKMVLRMEPPESNCESSRMREFQILKAVETQVPVPKPYCYDLDGSYLPYPAMIYAFSEGVAKPTASGGGVSGVGTYIPPQIRETLGNDFVEYMAKIHAFDLDTADISAFDIPPLGTQALEWELNHWERVWESDANEDVPLMRLAMAWLRNNMPPVDHVSIVHGDYRTGNFLFNEQDNRITAVLDWEMAYLGDRHADLAWATNPLLGHLAEDGETLLCGGFFPREEFIARYEKAAGLRVIPETLTYYDIFGSYKIIVICLATGYRAPWNGRTHQDVLVAWLLGISYSMLEDLRAKLEKVL